MSQDEYIAKTKFVTKLGLSLHSCGATSHRIERHLSGVSQMLGINGEFLTSPTSFTFVFWNEDPDKQLIRTKRVQPGGGDLGLLVNLDTLIQEFSDQKLSFYEMDQQLNETLKIPPYYNKTIQSLAWGVGSFFFSTLLSKSSYDAIVSGVISFFLFYLLDLCARRERFDNLIEITAAGSAGIIVSLIAALGAPINVPFCILSSIIILVPGLAITVALSEMAQRDLISGTAKFVDAVMSLIKLYLGAIIGIGIGAFILDDVDANTLHGIRDLPQWITWPALIMLTGAVTIAFNIHPKFIGWCLVSALVAYTISDLATKQFNYTTGVLLGSLAVGVYSNLYANITNHPASLVLSVGLILLVPGSKTYIILNSWITGKQMIEDTPNPTQAFLIFIALVGGLLLSNALVPTKKSL